MAILDIINTNSSQIIFYAIENFKQDYISSYNLPISDIQIIENTKGIKNKNERLAARICAKYFLKENYQGTAYLENGKPYLVANSQHISISHSEKIVCLILSHNSEIGIDIQPPSEKIRRIAKRVFNEEELDWANEDIDKLTQLWCIKETVFKASQIKGLNFKKGIIISPQKDDFKVQVTGSLKDKFYNVVTFKYDKYYVAYTL